MSDKEFLIRVRADIQSAVADMNRLTKEIDSQGKKARGAAVSHKQLGGAWASMAAAAGTYLTVSTAIKALRIADEFGVLQQRIKTATKATGDYNQVSRELYDISQRNGIALTDTVSVFQRLALSASALGATNQQIMQVTEAVQQLGVMSGASNTAMTAGLMQFSQAMGAGVVRAEEFNSIMENLPAVAERIAKGMKMTTSELRKAVLEGKVLSNEVFNSLKAQAPDIAKEMAEVPTSLSRSTQKLENSFGLFLNKLEQSTGYVKNLAWFFGQMADSIDKSDGSFSGFLAAAGAFGPEAMLQQGRVAETRRLQAIHKDWTDKISKMRSELVTLDGQINEQSTRLLQMDPVNTSDATNEASQALADLKLKREALNKTLDETEKKYQKLAKSGFKAVDEPGKPLVNYEKKLADVNKTLQKNIKLHGEQAKALVLAKQRVDAMQASFDLVRSGIDAKDKGAPGIIDISNQTLSAENLADKGDLEGAAKAAEKARDMIQELTRAGGESDIVLKGLLSRAERAAMTAVQGIENQRQADLDKTNTTITKLLTEAEKLKALKIGFDTEAAKVQADSLRQALEKSFADNPIKIPVVIGKKGEMDIPQLKPILPIPGHSSGGPITGPGSGTSDDVLMWGSNGEFMMPSAAVKHFGLGFMEQIRRRQLPRFADGGLVGLPALPSAPAGAPQGGAGTPVNLYLNGKNYPVTAAPDVAAEMTRAFQIETLQHGDVG